MLSPETEVAPVSTNFGIDSEIMVTWTDNSTNEDEFIIERGTGAGSGVSAASAQDFIEVGRVGANVTTFRDTGLNPATSYQYRVTACNENGCLEPAAMVEEIATHETLIIETTSLPDGPLGLLYDESLVATGGDGTFAWDIVEGTLPDALALSPEGKITGSPTATGTFTFTARVQSVEQESTIELSITVMEITAPEVTTTELPDGIVGRGYDSSLMARGGDDDYSWTLASGRLPGGLTLSAAGAIVGTPTAAGTSNFTVQVT